MGDQVVVLGVIGVGGWGKNLARNYFQLGGARLRYLCDLDEARLARVQAQFPAQRTTQDYRDLLNDPEVQAVVISTTGDSHYKLCDAALRADKDVYVEKPFVLNSDHARELIALARERKRVLMVGHLLEYHPVVTRLKQMIDAGDLGDIRYVYSQRLNLGTVREDENALWNFAPHDVSIILYLLGMEPSDVSARGQCYLREGVEDVAFMTLNFQGKSMGHVHVSWLDPHKTRRLTIVGSKRMAVFDDLETSEKLKIYDKGIDVSTDYDDFAEFVGLRFGDITIPHIRTSEPLTIECQHFLDCVRDRRQPLSDGEDGLRVVRVLEAAARSLALRGAAVDIE